MSYDVEGYSTGGCECLHCESQGYEPQTKTCRYYRP